MEAAVDGNIAVLFMIVSIMVCEATRVGSRALAVDYYKYRTVPYDLLYH